MELAQAYLSTKRPDQALYTYDSALLAKPALRRPATAHAGRAAALAALGRKREARAAAKKALALEPNNAQALDIANVGAR